MSVVLRLEGQRKYRQGWTGSVLRSAVPSRAEPHRRHRVNRSSGERSHMALDIDYIANVTCDLCRIPSPTGYTHLATDHVRALVTDLGLPVQVTTKGSLVVRLPSADAGPGRLLSAHVDTLGAMVK